MYTVINYNIYMNKKQKIIQLYEAGNKSLNDIAQEVGTYYGYVSTTIKQYKMEQQIKNLSN